MRQDWTSTEAGDFLLNLTGKTKWKSVFWPVNPGFLVCSLQPSPGVLEKKFPSSKDLGNSFRWWEDCLEGKGRGQREQPKLLF